MKIKFRYGKCFHKIRDCTYMVDMCMRQENPVILEFGPVDFLEYFRGFGPRINYVQASVRFRRNQIAVDINETYGNSGKTFHADIFDNIVLIVV